MNLRQRKKYNMYVQVNYYLNKHATDFSSHARIAAVKPDLEQLIKDIDEKEIFIMKDISGYAITKKKLRADLTDITFTIAKSLNKYATENNNTGIIKWTCEPGSFYLRLRDTDLYLMVEKISGFAQPLETELAAYGITADDILLLKNLKKRFLLEYKEPEFQIGLKADVRKEQAEIFKKADSLLNDKMDGYVNSFRFDSPELYRGYTLARRQK